MKFNPALLGILPLVFSGCQNAQKEKEALPNIIFFLVDDMGYMDCTINGSEYYETPNLERLAKNGIKFTNAYTANPLCSPTRASIISGKYPARFDLTTPAGHLPPNPDENLIPEKGAPWQKVACPKSRTFLPLEEYTFAEALKKVGYTTAHIGKWHMGHKDYWPKKQGFDINIGGGHYPGPPSYFSPYKIETLKDGPDKEYITDRLTQEALQYIENNKDTTFLLDLWHYAVHAPYQGKTEVIEKYKQKTDPRGKQDQPIMAAMIESMDESLGLVLDKLEELNLTKKTIIVFFSDNGGNMYDIVNGTYPTNNYPLKYGKGNIHEGGVRVPCVISWPGKIDMGEVSNTLISSIDFYPTFLEIAGLEKQEGQILDGISLLPELLKTGKIDRETIFCHFPHYFPVTFNTPATSVRKGKWKLIRFYGEGEDFQPLEKLFNLDEDISENNDLSEKYPDIVKELSQLIDEHVEDIHGKIPFINPAYNPDAESRMGKQNVFPIDRYPSY